MAQFLLARGTTGEVLETVISFENLRRFVFLLGFLSRQNLLRLACVSEIVYLLLLVGPYAWIGHNWMGCLTEEATPFIRPSELDVDYGEPLEDTCHEIGTSGVFTREWTKVSSVQSIRRYIRRNNQH